MTRRRWIILHVVAILLIAYVSSYVYISRQRFEEYSLLKIPGFLYVSPENLENDPEDSWRLREGLLELFYGPINKIDQECFGVPGPVCVMTGIGEKK